MSQKKVQQFFETHPQANEVYEALGVLFVEKEKAQKYLGGVSGHTVTTHTRPGKAKKETSPAGTDQTPKGETGTPGTEAGSAASPGENNNSETGDASGSDDTKAADKKPSADKKGNAKKPAVPGKKAAGKKSS